VGIIRRLFLLLVGGGMVIKLLIAWIVITDLAAISLGIYGLGMAKGWWK
jgi:hypothetical protein